MHPDLLDFAGEDDQLPPLRLMVVAQDVLRAVVAPDLEVAVVGSQPAVDELGHFDAAVTECEAAGCLLAAVPGVALDAQVHVGILAQPHAHFLPAHLSSKSLPPAQAHGNAMAMTAT